LVIRLMQADQLTLELAQPKAPRLPLQLFRHKSLHTQLFSQCRGIQIPF